MRDIIYIEKGKKIEKAFYEIIGGKAIQQALAAEENLPVLNGLVLTTEVFPGKSWLDIHEKDSYKDISKAVDDLLKKRNIDLYNALIPLKGKKYAVRSSATAEDLEIASFAGSFSTILNVKTINIFDAIYFVWQSAFSERVKKYFAFKKLNNYENIKMAVLIQPMLKPIISGVAFSHPLGKPEDPHIYVGIIRGLGERLVQGEVFPQVFSIERNTWRIIEQNDMRDSEIIYELASDIGRIIDYLEIKRGIPQDIEFAVEKNMEFILLQNRPIAKRISGMTSEENKT
jgi:pyruvate,water dikinase